MELFKLDLDFIGNVTRFYIESYVTTQVAYTIIFAFEVIYYKEFHVVELFA